MLEEYLAQKIQKLEDRIKKLERMANAIELASDIYLQKISYFGNDPSCEDIEERMRAFARELYVSWDIVTISEED